MPPPTRRLRLAALPVALMCALAIRAIAIAPPDGSDPLRFGLAIERVTAARRAGSARSTMADEQTLRANLQRNLGRAEARERALNARGEFFDRARLQAELERIFRHSQDPALLREWIAASGGEPDEFVRWIVRPLLIERFAALHGISDPEPGVPADPPSAPELAGFRWPDAVTAAPQCDVWLDSLPISGRPIHRQGAAAVWTGVEMIVWGGNAGAAHSNEGAAYSPALAAWRSLEINGAPSARSQPSAVWSGSELLVWGGVDSGNNSLATGGAYNPVTDRWRPLTNTLSPAARRGAPAVWTGTRMMVWGGLSNAGYLNDGGAYDPAEDQWTPLPIDANTPSARGEHVLVWTGSKLIAWGGVNYSTNGFDNGAVYDPAAGTWNAMAQGPYAPRGAAAIWTGDRMWVSGGYNYQTYFTTTAAYDPVGNQWSALPSLPLEERAYHSAVWTGSEMIVWGGGRRQCFGWSCSVYPLSSGARLDGAGAAWTALPASPLAARYTHAAVWTGTEMLVASGTAGDGATARYRRSLDAWLADTPGYPGPRVNHAAHWIGDELLVWGGATCASGCLAHTGGRYSPALAAWRPVAPPLAAPDGNPRENFSSVWTGAEFIYWGGSVTRLVAYGTQTATGGRYDPAADSWSVIGYAGALPAPRELAGAVWSGDELVIWGGRARAAINPNPWGYFSTGARYSPAAGSWTDLTHAAEPALRAFQSMGWGGGRLAVWGGGTDSTVYGDGATLVPSAGSWVPAAGGPPAARTYHSTAADGSGFFVWGGCPNTNCSFRYSDGSRFDIATGVWSGIPFGPGTPGARASHGSVWTGRELVIWGGWDGANYLNTGSRFRTADGAWRQMNGGRFLPEARASVPLVWTGNRMLLYGGGIASGVSSTGGVYAIDPPLTPGNTLAARKVSGSVRLTWIAGAGATAHEVRRCTPGAGACAAEQLAATVPLPVAEFSEGLGGSWFYRVTAINNCGAAD